jgi:hypothetical protein
MKIKRFGMGIVLAGALLLTTVKVDAAEVDLTSIASGSSGPYMWNGACNATLGVSQNLNQVLYVVAGTGIATATNGAVAVGTTVTCTMKDTSTSPSTVIGTISAGDPGPAGVVAGTITVNLGSKPILCATGNAVFNDGGATSGSDKKPGC